MNFYSTWCFGTKSACTDDVSFQTLDPLFRFWILFANCPQKITNQTNQMFILSMQLNGVFDFPIKLLLQNFGLTLGTWYWVIDASSECTCTRNLKNKVEDCKNMSYFMIPHRITLTKRQSFTSKYFLLSRKVTNCADEFYIFSMDVDYLHVLLPACYFFLFCAVPRREIRILKF